MEIADLILKKEQNILSNKEREKLQVIKDIVEEGDWMFRNDFDVVIGILEFLDVSEDRIKEIYTSLISPEIFSKTHPKERL